MRTKRKEKVVSVGRRALGVGGVRGGVRCVEMVGGGEACLPIVAMICFEKKNI